MKKINLLPSAYKKKIILKKVLLKMILTFGLMSAFFVLVIIFIELHYSIKEAKLMQLNDNYQKYRVHEDIITEYTLLSQEYKQYEEIEQYINSSPTADIGDLDILSAFLPDDCYYTGFFIDKNTISISGNAQKRKSVVDYLEKLNDMKRYSSVVLKELTNSNENIFYLIELTIAEEREVN